MRGPPHLVRDDFEAKRLGRGLNLEHLGNGDGTGGWYGVGGPTGTPAEIVNKLNNEINAALADPQLKARLADLGGTVIAGSPSDFGSFVAAETEKWAKVIKFAGIQAEWTGNPGPIFDNVPFRESRQPALCPKLRMSKFCPLCPRKRKTG